MDIIIPNFSQLTVNELKNILRINRLKLSGNKAELIRKLNLFWSSRNGNIIWPISVKDIRFSKQQTGIVTPFIQPLRIGSPVIRQTSFVQPPQIKSPVIQQPMLTTRRRRNIIQPPSNLPSMINIFTQQQQKIPSNVSPIRTSPVSPIRTSPILTDLYDLEPIPEIISHECNYQIDNPEEMKNLYNYLPNILTPVLIGKLKDKDFCFSQVVRLCENEGAVEICQGYKDILNRCPITSTQYILYLIDLVFLKNDRIDGRHSEAVLVDNGLKTIEFFEPNGPSVSWYPIVNSLLEYKFSQILPSYKYLSTGEFCPYIGPQAKSELPICGAFSLLFLLLKVFNPNHTSGEIISMFVNLPRPELVSLMNKFICYVVSYDQKNNLTSFQNLYDLISEKIMNIPELTEQVDKFYYQLDRQGLINFADIYGLQI